MDGIKSLLKVLKKPDFLSAIVLFACGIVIAVTGMNHASIVFDTQLFGCTLLALLCATAASVFLNKDILNFRTIVFVLINLIVSSVLFGDMQLKTLATMIIAWALIHGLATLAFIKNSTIEPKEVFIQFGLHLALAVSVFLTFNDQIMVIGLFGAFAILSSVFLAIASIDSKGDKSSKLEKTK